MPACALHVDVATTAGGADGTPARPFRTLTAAIAAASDGAIICVAEGTYPESLTPGPKPLTLAGGFQTGRGFIVRDSARYVSKAQGSGSDVSLRIEDPGPMDQLTAVDGFEITGYSQAIVPAIRHHQELHSRQLVRGVDVGRRRILAPKRVGRAQRQRDRPKHVQPGWGPRDQRRHEFQLGFDHEELVRRQRRRPLLFVSRLTIGANELTGNSSTGWGGGLYVGAFTGSPANAGCSELERIPRQPSGRGGRGSVLRRLGALFE